MTELNIKCFLKETLTEDSESTICSFKLSENSSYEQLVQCIKDEFTTDLSPHFKTYWLDDEKDFVLFKTDLRWKDVKKRQTNGTLKLYVQNDKSNSQNKRKHYHSESEEKEVMENVVTNVLDKLKINAMLDQFHAKLDLVSNTFSQEVHEIKDQLAKKAKNDEGSITMSDIGEPNYDKYYIYHKERGRITHEDDKSVFDTALITLKEKYKTSIALAEEDEWKEIKERDFTEKEQHTLFDKIITSLSLIEEIFEMRHEKEVKSKRRPDYVSIHKSGTHKINLLYASFVVEILVADIFDKKHLGKLVLYNEEVLNSNPRRPFVISVLTNLNDMVLIKSEPGPDKNGNFQNEIIHRISKPMNFWIKGLNYIKQMYEEPETVGYDDSYNFSIQISRGETDTPVKYQLHRLLGKGLTARVYSLVDCENMEESKDLVAKIFNRTDKSYFENEQKIMDKIAQRAQLAKFQKSQNNDESTRLIEALELRMHDDGTVMYKLNMYSDKFVQRVASNESNLTIIYTPRGKRLKAPITRQQFDQMFECVNELVKSCIVHRDLTPSHFLSTITSSDKTEKIFLIDFGSATFIRMGDPLNLSNLESSDAEDIRHNYRGSVRFAATEILKKLINKEPYKPRRHHDLESFVKMFYYLYLGDNDSFGNDTDNYKRIQSAFEYWDKIEKNAAQFWKDALQITRDESLQMLDDLYQYITVNYPAFKV